MKNQTVITLENEEGFRALFEHATLSIIVADETGIINLSNPCTEKLFGYASHELIGQPVEMLIPAELHSRHRQYRDQYFHSPEARPMGFGRDLYGQHKNGYAFPVEISLGHYQLGKKRMAVAFITDISERKKAEEILRVSEETTRLIMNAALDAIICINTDGLITVWNPQAEKMFGWTETEVKGRAIADIIIPLQYRAMHIKGMLHYLQTGEGPVLNRLVEITALNRDGREFPIELSIVPVKQNDREFFCAFLRDITDRKRTEERNKQHADELKQKNTELEQFTFVASHDLQEPLRTVSDFAALLKKKCEDIKDEKAHQYIRFIMEGAERMRRLVKDLLDYSRLGRQRHLELVDCNLVVENVISDLTVAIREAGATVQVEALPVIPGYPTEIKQLFQNLLSNALKFRKEHEPPLIKIAAQQQPDGWQFSVKDNGIGIEEKYWNRIFVIFQRLHAKSKYEGTGIGLAHCKKIADLHYGKIWLSSTPGKGSTFYFTVRTRNEAL